MFSDILLTVDCDHTLTDVKSVIPQRNLDAIRWFMERGGTFTVNTGRSVNTMGPFLDILPYNAPLLLFNGAVAYDRGRAAYCTPIDLPLWPTIEAVAAEFPELNLEIQTLNNHYLVNEKPDFVEMYDYLGWGHAPAVFGTDLGPFIKFALFGAMTEGSLDDFYRATAEETARFQHAADFILSRWGDKVDISFAAPRILDVQAKGINKLRAARDLQNRLGKKILVCVGDAQNDVVMLDGADYSFCPCDAVVADRYPNVCSCDDGAVADVIYKKIPEILGLSLDIRE